MSRLLAFGLVAALAVVAFALSPQIQSPALAQDTSAHSNLPVPRFASIDASRVRMRQGPSREHRILWEFRGQQGLPVEIVAETESWRQIRDPDGDLGWVHRSLLSERRGVVVAGGMRPLRRRPAPDAQTIAYMEARVVARLNECTAEWCEVSVQGYTGWVRHDEVWGVYPREVVN